MKLFFSYLILVGLTLTYTHPGQALEIYSTLTHDCQLNEGLILATDANKVEMLTLDGKYQTIKRDDVRYLSIYNTIDNPFPGVYLNARLKELLVEVYVHDSDRPTFIGWPVKFVENLVLFFDLNGKSHIFELYKIRKLRPYVNETLKKVTMNHQPVKLSYSSWVSQCSLPNEKAKDVIRPTRILGDQIQISEFISQFEIGFENVTSFQERTYVYARPFLFEKATKLGFVTFNDLQLSPKPTMPMYFQWTKGREFRFQSYNQVGSAPNEYLPTVEPLTLFRSDLKSHVFHASFVGNLNALSAGTEYFTPAQDNDVLPYKIDKPDFISHSAASLNYMALMGGDWGPWSLSIGTYFPNFMFQTKTDFREVLGSKLAPLFRLMYTGRHFRLRGLYGQTRLSADGQVADTQVSRDLNQSVIGYLSAFSFDSSYLRAGIDYQFTRELEVTLDQLWLQASYSETLSTNARNSFDFTHLVTQSSIRHYFGDYVSLRAYVQFFKVDEQFNFSGSSDDDNTTNITYGGTFEFIF